MENMSNMIEDPISGYSDNIYNIAPVHKSLIILDWDDTLFPTYWIKNNNINIDEIINIMDIDFMGVEEQLKTAIYSFKKLDNIIYDFLSKTLAYNSSIVLIITNASYLWVEKTLRLLKKTKKIIDTKVPIISARDLYRMSSANTHEWKKKVFTKVINVFSQEHNAFKSQSHAIQQQNYMTTNNSPHGELLYNQNVKWRPRDNRDAMQQLRFASYNTSQILDWSNFKRPMAYSTVTGFSYPNEDHMLFKPHNKGTYSLICLQINELHKKLANKIKNGQDKSKIAKMLFKNICLHKIEQKYNFNLSFNKSQDIHIISIGDAIYEYNALVNLYNTISSSQKYVGNALFKTVKLMESPSILIILDQLKVLSISISKIIKYNNHLDIKFNKK